MLTPVDIQNKVFKGGIGYDKKEVETFMSELASDYGELYRSSVELKDKVATLDESLQHYRSIEESMQKALTLSEKTAEETVNAANDKARQINTEAEKKAEALLADAKAELQETKEEIYRLQQQHATFKAQFSKILNAQLKLMDGEVIDIDLGDFEPTQSHESGFGNFSGGGFGGEGGLGGLGSGGGYTGSGSEGRERTNQEPAFDRGTLNMDPFADAMSGGGRFSKQTGGSYNSNSSGKKKAASNNSATKSTLNVKDVKPGSNKVKKNFSEAPSKQPTTSAANQNVQPTPNPAPQPVTPPTPSPAPQPATPPTPKPVPKPKAVNPAESQSQSAVQGQNQQPGSIKLNVQTEQSKATPKVNVAPAPQENIVKPQPTPVPPKTAPEAEQVTGEVETRVNEANMIDSEDNYSDGFDFVSEGDAATTAEAQSPSDFFDEDTVTGEVEDRINEATMIDSEDNYNDGFDFVSEGEPVGTETGFASSVQTFSDDEDTYSGEVEDRVNEATMIDSEDNYNDGFDFVVGNENEQEEIPTILPNLNIDPFANISSNNNTDSSDDDVLVGDVEDNVKQSNLIGNADDEEEGFNFL